MFWFSYKKRSKESRSSPKEYKVLYKEYKVLYDRVLYNERRVSDKTCITMG